MKAHREQLKRELEQAGAKPSEIDTLISIADGLKMLKPTDARAGHGRLANVLKPVLLASSVLVIGVVVVMIAQSVMPTSWLYPVQKLSDAVAVKAHPEYRATVMMRRAQQVNELVASRASSRVVLSTLDSYEAEAAGYKAMASANYAAFSYCKTNLEKAAAAAPSYVRRAINNSLDSLDTT